MRGSHTKTRRHQEKQEAMDWGLGGRLASRVLLFAPLSFDGMCIKLVVIGLTFFEERSQAIGKGLGFGAIGLKASGFVDVVIPVFRPYSVFGARLGFPGEHCGVKGYVQGVAEFCEDKPWIFEEFSRIKHEKFLTYGVKFA